MTVVGSKLYVQETFNACHTKLNIEKVTLCKDVNFKESSDCFNWRHQTEFIINCFENLSDDLFTNEFVYDTQEVQHGDKVYAVILNNGDPYGSNIVGLFSKRPDKDFILKAYIGHYNNAVKMADGYLDDTNKAFDDEYTVEDIIELEVE